MPPVPCVYCGNNFMLHDLNPGVPRYCNNCIKYYKKPITEETKVSKIEIIITCEREDQIEIEEICINEGISFSEYFMRLHDQCSSFKKACPSLPSHTEEKKPVESKPKRK